MDARAIWNAVRLRRAAGRGSGSTGGEPERSRGGSGSGFDTRSDRGARSDGHVYRRTMRAAQRRVCLRREGVHLRGDEGRAAARLFRYRPDGARDVAARRSRIGQDRPAVQRFDDDRPEPRRRHRRGVGDFPDDRLALPGVPRGVRVPLQDGVVSLRGAARTALSVVVTRREKKWK